MYHLELTTREQHFLEAILAMRIRELKEANMTCSETEALLEKISKSEWRSKNGLGEQNE